VDFAVPHLTRKEQESHLVVPADDLKIKFAKVSAVWAQLPNPYGKVAKQAVTIWTSFLCSVYA
jgi:hypothetical protein